MHGVEAESKRGVVFRPRSLTEFATNSSQDVNKSSLPFRDAQLTGTLNRPVFAIVTAMNGSLVNADLFFKQVSL